MRAPGAVLAGDGDAVALVLARGIMLLGQAGVQLLQGCAGQVLGGVGRRLLAAVAVKYAEQVDACRICTIAKSIFVASPIILAGDACKRTDR